LIQALRAKTIIKAVIFDWGGVLSNDRIENVRKKNIVDYVVV